MENTCKRECIVRLALTLHYNADSDFTSGIILAGTVENFEGMMRVYILTHI